MLFGMQSTYLLMEYWAEVILAGIIAVWLLAYLRRFLYPSPVDKGSEAINEQIYQRLVESASDIIYQIDSKGCFSYVNPVAVEITGYAREELIGRKYLDLIRPDYRSRLKQFYRSQVKEDGQNTYREFPIRTKTGEDRWIGQWVTVNRASKNDFQIYAIARDITPTREMQQELASQNRRLRLLTENVQDLIGLHMPDGTYEWISQSSKSLLGYEPEELIGKTPYEILHPADVDQIKDYISEIVQNNYYHDFFPGATIRIRHKEGYYIWVETLVKPLFNEAGELERFQTSSRDVTDRIRFESALEESELKLRLFIKHTPAAVAMFDREMKYIMVSDRWLSDYGLDGADIIGESHYDLFPNMPEHWKGIHRRCLMGNVETADEDSFINSNGEREWLRWAIHPWKNSENEIGGLIMFSELITERKKSEEQLLRNQELFLVVAEARKELVSNADYEQAIYKTLKVVGESVGIDRITVFTQVDQEQQLFKYEYRWVLENMAEVHKFAQEHHEVGDVVPLTKFGNADWCERLRKDGVVQKLTTEMTGDVADRYAEVGIRSIIMFPIIMNNQLWGIIRLDDFLSERRWTDNEQSIIRAISTSLASQHERKLAEQAVLEEQEQLRSVIENAPIPIILIDDKMRIQTHSSRWVEQFPTADDELMGDIFWNKYPEWEAYWQPILEQGLQGKVLSENEDKITDVSGTDKYYRWAVHPWQRAGHKVDGVILVVDQIDELVNARLEAESANRAKSTFLANMSHELRTPLNAILGYAQILKQDPNLSEAMNPYVETIYNSGDHLLAMINDILDISKIEAGRMELHISEFDVFDLFRDIEWMFALRAEKKGIQFNVSLAEDVPRFLESDPSKWRQIIINLVSNAIKFTSDGTVVINGAWIDKDDNQVLDSVDLSAIKITVTDTGIGIPDDQQEEIFKPFQQVTGRYNEGTGLGLSITKHLVKQLGGYLKLRSSKGQGTRFTIVLPAKQVSKIVNTDGKKVDRSTSASEKDRANVEPTVIENRWSASQVADILMENLDDHELTELRDLLRLQNVSELSELSNEAKENNNEPLTKALKQVGQAAKAFDFYFITQVYKNLQED